MNRTMTQELEKKMLNAANAPEKLYIALFKGKFNVSHSPVNNSVEYVHKDVFVDKALKFIKTNVDRIVNNQYGVCMGCMDWEFRKYMKGE